jgi:hypothetical protein
VDRPERQLRIFPPRNSTETILFFLGVPSLHSPQITRSDMYKFQLSAATIYNLDRRLLSSHSLLGNPATDLAPIYHFQKRRQKGFVLFSQAGKTFALGPRTF